jgi:hypothetical protein
MVHDTLALDHSSLQMALDRLEGEQPTSMPKTAPLSNGSPSSPAVGA